MRCLVTGGAGFIGSHLVERLVGEGHEVRVLDDVSTGSRANLAHLNGRFEFVEGDIRNPEACTRCVAGVEVVFHVAALPSVSRSLENPWASHDVNVTGTVRLLEASRKAGVRRVVYSSSSSVYGDTPTLPKAENLEPLPRSPYAAAKLAGEQFVLSFARAGFVEGVALRYFNVFGPRQDPNSAYAAVVPAFLKSARDQTPVPLYGDGFQTRDFTFVENVVEANLLAATKPAPEVSGWVVNVGSGRRTSLRELMELVDDITGCPVVIDPCPPRGGDVRDSLAALDRAAAVLGYRPRVSLAQGLKHTWEWISAIASTPQRE